MRVCPLPQIPANSKGEPPPLMLVYGTAALMRQRVVDGIINRALPEAEREWGLSVIDAQEVGVDGILSQLGSGSLMADSRVIVVRGVEKLSNSAQKDLAASLGTPPPGTILIVDAQSNRDYRRKGPPVAAALRKMFEEHGQITEASAPSDRELPAWVVDELAARGKKTSLPVARAFVEIVGGGVEFILNEIEKLVTYVGPQADSITIQDVRQITSGEQESTVFDLVDAIGRRDARTALSVLPDLLPASGAHGAAMPLLAMIARQLRLVWQARALASHGVSLESTKALPEEWGSKLPVDHNFRDVTKGRRFLVTKYAEQARNFTDVQLVRAMVKVYETDLALKGQAEERMDDRLALETLVVALCRL